MQPGAHKEFAGFVARPFNENHLDNLLHKLQIEDVILDKKVREFLLDMGNEFVEQVVKNSYNLGKKKKKLDPQTIKFVMKQFYDVEIGRIPAEEPSKK